jgi:ipoprotein LpqH
MQKRSIAQKRSVVVGVAAIVAVAGCSSTPPNSHQPPGSLPVTTAQVSVNGQPASTTHKIDCSQDGWMHTLKTGDDKSGVTVVVDTGDTVRAESVVITNVGDFTGSAYENKIGRADATIIGTTFQVNGTAEGATNAQPNQPTTANFEIKVNC